MNMEDLYRLLRADHVQAQGIVDTVHDPMLVLDTELVIRAANRAFFETFQVGRDDAVGRSLHDLGNGEWDIPDLRLLLKEVIPRSTAVVDFEVSGPFLGLGQKTMLVTSRRLYHPDNASQTMLVSFVDATERYRQDAATKLMFGEMRHRFRNLGALALSISRQMNAENLTVEEFRDSFLDRLGSLIRAEELSFQDPSGQLGLKELLHGSLAPFGVDRGAVIVPEVPEVHLSAPAIRSLAIVLHELGTNAMKHGALSSPYGRVTVGCSRDPDGRLLIEWVETGGPATRTPARTGFGTELMRSTIQHALSGEFDQRFDANGMTATLSIPVTPAEKAG